MQSHYHTLGLKSSASADEIRRAYRILARRYHPDLNPGKENSERFRRIAEAYEVLSDSEKRAKYDAQAEIEERENMARGFSAYQKAQKKAASARGQRRQRAQATQQRTTVEPKVTPERKKRGVSSQLKDLLRGAMGIAQQKAPSHESAPTGSGAKSVSVIEVSLSIREAMHGTKKALEIPEPTGPRKLSVSIPAGVRNGSVIRLRSKTEPNEDLVLIVRIASHPFLSLQTRGLVAEIPISILEAISGANVSIPTLEEPVLIKVPPGSQSGSEVRLKGRGAFLKDGTRGDLFVRFLVKIPESLEAVGLSEKAQELERYYNNPVRQSLPRRLID